MPRCGGAFLLALTTIMETANLIIRNGTLLNPAGSAIFTGDLAVTNGRISAIGPHLPGQGELEIDASSLMVAPGFIDHHCHIFSGGSNFAITADAVSFPTGCTTLVDAGSSGAGNFLGFYHNVISRCDTQALAYLNISTSGQVSLDLPEIVDPQLVRVKDIEQLLRAYPQIRGLKIRYDESCVRGMGIRPLRFAADLAHQLHVPLVVHIANHPGSYAELVQALAKGDVVCHCFQNSAETILNQDRRIQDAVWEARERGVIFDSCDGKRNYTFKVVEAALADGFKPDIISTDLIRDNTYTHQVYGLPYTLSKYLMLGMDLLSVIRCATLTPARVMKLEGVGSLDVGMQADICIFKLMPNARLKYCDKENEVRFARNAIVPLCTIASGQIKYASLEFYALQQCR